MNVEHLHNFICRFLEVGRRPILQVVDLGPGPVIHFPRNPCQGSPVQAASPHHTCRRVRIGIGASRTIRVVLHLVAPIFVEFAGDIGEQSAPFGNSVARPGCPAQVRTPLHQSHLKGLPIARIDALFRNPGGKEKAGHSRAHDDQIISLVRHL